MVLSIAILTACGEGDEPKEQDQGRPRTAEPRPLARVEEVVKRESDALLRRYKGAVGVGVGSVDRDKPRPPEDPVYIVVIYLRDRDALPEGDESVEGVPIRFVVTGEFRAG